MDRIGNFEIRSEIGRGSFGVVYRAYDPILERPVAVRVLPAQADPAFISLFRAKVGAAAKLRHKNIADVLLCGVENGIPYVAMEYLEGSDLQQILRHGAPLTMVEKIGILNEVAEGLHYAHEQGLIHGGIKLANIMRLPDGSVKLLDFGIALVNPGVRDVSENYMLPEQLREHPVDELSDMWAFGAVLYELLTGRPPFSTLLQVSTEDPPPIQTLAPDCPASIAAMGARLLNKNRDQRYQNVADLIVDLNAAKRELAANEISALLDRIPMRLEAQDLDGAQSMIRRVLDLDPSNAYARQWRENLRGEAKQPSRTLAEEPLAPLDHQEREYVSDVLTKVQILMEKGAFEEGNHLASEALHRYPANTAIQWIMEQITLRAREQARAQGTGSGLEQARQLIATTDPSVAELMRHAEDQMAGAKSDPPLNPVDEDVQFSVFRPRAVPPDVWKMLLVFAHRTSRTPNSSEADPVQEVQRQAELILGEQIHEYPKVSQDSAQAIPRQGVLTFLPEVEGITFQPSVQSVTWTGRVPPAIFLLSSTSQYRGRTLRGQICVFLGNIVVAQVPLAIRVEENANLPETPYVSEQVRWYRRIFASYSHQDTAIVEEFENHAIAFGDDYLRDLKTLRAGSDWNESVRRMIRDADVFQLFWSYNSMNSKYVRQEYNYALSLGREGFVRPVYWEVPMPESKESGQPPPELQAIHFHRIALSASKAQPSSAAAPVSHPGGVWYYLDAQGQAAAPVDDAAFENLVGQGVVRDDTLVWQEGMADWRPYSTVRPAPAGANTMMLQIPSASGLADEKRNPPSGSSIPIPAAALAPAAPSRSLETRICSRCGKSTPTNQLSIVKGEPTCAKCEEEMHPAGVLFLAARQAVAPPLPYSPPPYLPAATVPDVFPAARPARRRKAFGFVMMLLVLAALVAAALVYFFWLGSRVSGDRGLRRALAISQIHAFTTALVSYKSDSGTFPTTGQGLDALRAKPADVRGWAGPYLGQDTPLDPWGHPYVYIFPGDHGELPDIISLGADGQPGGDGENADVVSWEKR